MENRENGMFAMRRRRTGVPVRKKTVSDDNSKIISDANAKRNGESAKREQDWRRKQGKRKQRTTLFSRSFSPRTTVYTTVNVPVFPGPASHSWETCRSGH